MGEAKHDGARTGAGLAALLAAALLAGACAGVAQLGSGENGLVSAVGEDSEPIVGFAPLRPAEFIINLPKDRFGMGDPIRVRMTLRNAGKKPMTVNKRLLVNDRAAPPGFREVYFTITTPGGGNAGFAWDIRAGFPEAKDFLKLKPGASVSAKVDLNDLYFLEEVGTYHVKATYQNVHRGPTVFDDATGDASVKDMGAARIKLSSEKLEFRITG
jgi:hypothetical protein